MGVTRKQLDGLVKVGIIARELPDTYRMTAVAPSNGQRLRAALLWAGDGAAGAVRSAGEVYRLDGISAAKPEINIPRSRRLRSPLVIVHQPTNEAATMVRAYRGMRVTGVEATLTALAHALDGESFEIACEDARRRQLTSVAALRSYLRRFARQGVPGTVAMRTLLDDLDPVHAARSALEVKPRRLLVANDVRDFVREFPLVWQGRRYLYDFGFPGRRTILETNGRRWHDDPNDYEHDHEKWSVPGRLGYRIVFATWDKVTERPEGLLAEITATLAA
jgi:very-short-patch-repair endonuclease